MVNQILVAAGLIGICEALLYASKAGLDIPTVLQSISRGAAGSWALDNYPSRMLAGRFEPGFIVEHFIKDMRILLDEARRMHLALPGLALVQQLYQALAAQGGARQGAHALVLALERLSHVEWQDVVQAQSTTKR
jgi:3-hydroxyisobutyrate dehydrogenase